MSRRLRLSSLVLLLTAACSHRTGGPSRLADGGYALACRSPLADCLHHAERLCRDDGYTVTEARDIRERLGHESGQSQVVIEKSEATIYCGAHETRAPIELKRPPEPVSATPAPAPAPTPVVRAATAPVCTPGATQACVGPAGCSGGQACAPDGTHYEPCNCGPAATGTAP